MSQYFYTFSRFSPTQLVPQLVALLNKPDLGKQTNLNKICWLQNSGQPIIGLLPKKSWLVYVADEFDSSLLSLPHKKKDSYNAVTVKILAQERNCTLSRQQNQTNASISAQLYTTTYDNWVEELIAYSKQQDSLTSNVSTVFDNSDPHLYQHGLMGFIGYDIAARDLSQNHAITFATQPCAFIGHYDIYLTPHMNDEQDIIGWQLHTQEDTKQTAIDNIHHYLSQLDKTLAEAKGVQLTHSKSDSAPINLTKTWQYSQYETAFGQTQYYLKQGDSYQINLTQRWQSKPNHASKNLRLSDHLAGLYHSTQAPYAGYIYLGGFELLSCSPELFLAFKKDSTGHHHVYTKPIKGTRVRGQSALKDNALRYELITSEKDQAENVMIVDLLRNDLGKYAKTGSVKVPKLFAIESFSNVHHMVSTVVAEVKTDVHPLSVLFGSLPAGSVTGTPKKRAVELIATLESAPRGAYCGTLGYMNFDGTGQWNVLIRTLQADEEGQVSLWAGGGITVASDCKAEYQESVDKVANLIKVIGGC